MAHPQEAGWVRISVERESSSAADREVGGGLSRHNPCLARFPGGKTLTCRFGCVPGEAVSETFLRDAFAWSKQDVMPRTGLQRGYREIRLYTHQTMEENQRLYASIGYEETGRSTEADCDRVFMRKQLRR